MDTDSKEGAEQTERSRVATKKHEKTQEQVGENFLASCEGVGYRIAKQTKSIRGSSKVYCFVVVNVPNRMTKSNKVI